MLNVTLNLKLQVMIHYNQGGGSAHDLFTSSGVIYRKYIMKVRI